MERIMYELAEYMGFNMQAQTFPDLITQAFIAICGTAIIASLIKAMLYIACSSRKLVK